MKAGLVATATLLVGVCLVSCGDDDEGTDGRWSCSVSEGSCFCVPAGDEEPRKKSCRSSDYAVCWRMKTIDGDITACGCKDDPRPSPGQELGICPCCAG